MNALFEIKLNIIFALKYKLMAKRIGILSDTHGYWDERYKKYFAECDEIWHC